MPFNLMKLLSMSYETFLSYTCLPRVSRLTKFTDPLFYNEGHSDHYLQCSNALTNPLFIKLKVNKLFDLVFMEICIVFFSQERFSFLTNLQMLNNSIHCQ